MSASAESSTPTQVSVAGGATDTEIPLSGDPGLYERGDGLVGAALTVLASSSSRRKNVARHILSARDKRRTTTCPCVRVALSACLDPPGSRAEVFAAGDRTSTAEL